MTSPATIYRPRTTEARTLNPSGAPADQGSAGEPRTRESGKGGVLRIGDLAVRSGVSVDALRYYERRGLLRPTGRRASGYREYPPEAAALVRFIKRAQALGFTLAEVEELVRLRADARRPAAALAARDVATAKVRDIDERVRQLLALRGALTGLVKACEATCGPDGPADDASCPIIGALDDDPPGEDRTTPAQTVPGVGLHAKAIPTPPQGDHDDEP